MPRNLNDLDVFYDPSQSHAFSPAFDESTPTSAVKPAVSGSQNTQSIDAFTQGVELTQLARHDAGLVKIWSGEPGHEMLRTWYGERGPSKTTAFIDYESSYLRDPVAVVKNSPHYKILTFPIAAVSPDLSGALRYPSTVVKHGSSNVTIRTTQDLTDTINDGVIEPLQIRLQPSFYNAAVPATGHQVIGSFGNGNEDALDASDRVLTVDYFSPVTPTVPFNDVIARLSGSRFSNPSVSVAAFIDVRHVRNAIDTNIDWTTSVRPNDWQIGAALALMTGSTDSYIHYNQRSATCGWGYDNSVTVGTDSLTFGGMTY